VVTETVYLRTVTGWLVVRWLRRWRRRKAAAPRPRGDGKSNVRVTIEVFDASVETQASLPFRLDI
jgi:hypothetical protein